MGSLGIIFGLIGIFYLFSNINGFLIFTTIELLIFSFIIHREYVHKPKKVEISSNSIILFYRLNKPLIINFNEIIDITILIGKHNNNTGHNDGESTIKINKTLPYIVNIDIGLKIRERYKQTIGAYPPGKIVYR